MTTDGWVTCANTTRKLAAVQWRLTERRATPLMTACLRRVWPLLTDPRARAAGEVAERAADGQAGRFEVQAARSEAVAARSAPSSAVLARVAVRPRGRRRVRPAYAAAQALGGPGDLLPVVRATAAWPAGGGWGTPGGTRTDSAT